VGEQGLAQGNNPLLDTGDRALDHDEVVVDLTVADEATEAVLLAFPFELEVSKISKGTYGVMVFLVMSASVEPLSSAPALPTR
jgi:hypothetical protein